jgi:hypothetical protein
MPGTATSPARNESNVVMDELRGNPQVIVERLVNKEISEDQAERELSVYLDAAYRMNTLRRILRALFPSLARNVTR